MEEGTLCPDQGGGGHLQPLQALLTQETYGLDPDQPRRRPHGVPQSQAEETQVVSQPTEKQRPSDILNRVEEVPIGAVVGPTGPE